MPRENRRTYQVGNMNREEMNFILQQISDRLDELEGYRGTPTFKANIDMDSNRITTLGTGTADTDALRKDQADQEDTSLQGQITAHVNDVSNPHSVTLDQARGAGETFSGTVQWLDTDGAVIHEFK